jgi:hypothetical protein
LKEDINNVIDTINDWFRGSWSLNFDKKCNVLQSNDSSYSWRANIFYFYIYEW